jgi:hypothetical protein
MKIFSQNYGRYSEISLFATPACFHKRPATRWYYPTEVLRKAFIYLLWKFPISSLRVKRCRAFRPVAQIDTFSSEFGEEDRSIHVSSSSSRWCSGWGVYRQPFGVELEFGWERMLSWSRGGSILSSLVIWFFEIFLRMMMGDYLIVRNVVRSLGIFSLQSNSALRDLILEMINLLSLIIRKDLVDWLHWGWIFVIAIFNVYPADANP